MKYESFNVQQLTKRKNKPWQARLKYKDPISGKWRETSKMLPNVTGKREAKKAAEAWFNEMNNAASISPTLSIDKTVKEMVTEYIEYQRVTGEIEESTYTRQIKIVGVYIEPYIGDISFITLDKTAIRNWLTRLNANGLSQGTIGRAYQITKKVYNHYYETGDIVSSPFTGIKAPRRSKPNITHLTNEQMDDYLTALYANYEPTDPFYAGALLLLYAGLRRGEVCGLRWRDVDLEQGTITVETAIGVASGKGTSSYTKQPKNESSIRTFPMIPQLTYALKECKEATNPEPNWFVCGKKTNHFHPCSFGRMFRQFVLDNGLTDAYGNTLSPHKMRHNLGAIGIKSGMDIASLSNMFGHGSRAMTLDTYGDATKDAKIVASKKLGERFDAETEYFRRADIEPEYTIEEQEEE